MEQGETLLQRQYRQYLARKVSFIVLLAVGLAVIAAVSLNIGSSGMTVRESLNALLNFGPPVEKHARIVFDIRMPRIIGGFFVGVSIALSGLIIQSVLNNPLASPSTLGISSASAFGANVAIIVFARLGLETSSLVTSGVSFLSAICCMVFVLALSSLKRSDRTTVLLGGVAVNALFGAMIVVVQFLADDTELASAVSWTFGDLGRINYSEIRIIMTVTLLSVLAVHRLRWQFNAMDMGERTAHSLGVNTKAIRNLSIALAALNTGVSVAFAGIIGFVGILAPAMVKRVIGEDKRFMIPASLLTGALIVLAGDAVARTAVSPLVLPVGAVTSLLGAPVFVYLLMTER